LSRGATPALTEAENERNPPLRIGARRPVLKKRETGERNYNARYEWKLEHRFWRDEELQRPLWMEARTPVLEG